MSLSILGLGTALPETAFDQAEGLAIARSLIRPTPEQATWLPGIYQGSRIQKRHTVLPRELIQDLLHHTRNSNSVFLPSVELNGDGPTTAQRMAIYHQNALPLAIQSCRQALQRAAIPSKSITHLVTVSCTGFAAPGWDCALIPRLELSPTVERTHVGFMGCHGALNGLRVARALVDSDHTARVLLCAVELCTLHYHYRWDAEKVVANALFADGAAALVGMHESNTAKEHWQVVASGSFLLPDSEKAMSWRVGNHGFDMTLSKQVPELIKNNLFQIMETWLEKNRETVSSIASWAIHPGGPKILTTVVDVLRLTERQWEDSFAVYTECGNMSSPTLLFILDRMQRRQAPRPCVALGFGPGLTIECTLFR